MSYILDAKQYISHRNILLVTFGAERKSNWQQKDIKVFMHCMKHFHEKMTIYERETSVNVIIITKSYYTDISWRGLLHVLVFICFNHFKIINTGQIQKIVYSVGVVFKMHLIIYWWWVNIFGGISNKVLQSRIPSLQWARPKTVLS